jgi:hypothetical protein
MTLEEALRTHDFAQGLTDSQVATLAGMAQEVTFVDDEVILEAGQRSMCLRRRRAGKVEWLFLSNGGSGDPPACVVEVRS